MLVGNVLRKIDPLLHIPHDIVVRNFTHVVISFTPNLPLCAGSKRAVEPKVAGLSERPYPHQLRLRAIITDVLALRQLECQKSWLEISIDRLVGGSKLYPQYFGN